MKLHTHIRHDAPCPLPSAITDLDLLFTLYLALFRSRNIAIPQTSCVSLSEQNAMENQRKQSLLIDLISRLPERPVTITTSVWSFTDPTTNFVKRVKVRPKELIGVRNIIELAELSERLLSECQTV